MEWGATFSHRNLKEVGIDWWAALEEYAKQSWPWIRLGAYWDEVEPERGKFRFEEMDELVQTCIKHGLKVVMTVGTKAPRWPEFYVPAWAHDLPGEPVLPMIEKVVKRYRREVNIWQVENEPLDPSGPENKTLTFDQLKKEVELVRSLDSAKNILLTVWGNELSRRGHYKKLTDLADIVGLDLYPKVPVKIGNLPAIYRGPSDSMSNLKRIIEEIKQTGKKVWLTELQAEPWGDESSCQPEDVVRNAEWGKQLQPNLILLWGFEWRYRQFMKGDRSYWEAVGKSYS